MNAIKKELPTKADIKNAQAFLLEKLSKTSNLKDATEWAVFDKETRGKHEWL